MTVPGSPLSVGTIVVVTVASLFATQPAHAQRFLSWRSPSSLQGVDPTKDLPAAMPPTELMASLERVAPAITTQQQDAIAKAESSWSELVPVLPNPVVSIEPLPSSNPVVMEVAGIVSKPLEAAAITDTPVASVQISSCDETGRCERLDAVRSGMGLNRGPKDEEARRLPVKEAKRHVLQSVRSIW